MKTVDSKVAIYETTQADRRVVISRLDTFTDVIQL